MQTAPPPTSTPMVLQVTPLLRVFDFDGAGERHAGLCELRREDGSTARFAVPVAVLRLLAAFDGTTPTPAVIDRVLAAQPGAADRAGLERLVDGFLRARGLLVPAGAAVVEPPAEVAGRAPYLHAQVQLLPARVVLPVALRLGWLLRGYVAMPLLAVVLTAHLLFARDPRAASLQATDVQGGEVVLLALITMATALVHELGHAAAGARFGCRRVSIGWGLYLYFAVFFTDLSEAWRLPRRQRMVVDAAGMYFQALCLIALLIAFQLSGWVLLLHAFLLVELMIASSLNPFFRMDGYWLVSDGLGIPNLRSESRRVLRSVLGRLRGGADPEGARIPAGTRWALVAYTLGSVGFFAYITGAILIGWGASLLQAYPDTVRAVWAAAAEAPFDPSTLAARTVDLLWRGLILFGMAVFLGRLGSAALRMAAQAWRSLSRRTGVAT